MFHLFWLFVCVKAVQGLLQPSSSLFSGVRLLPTTAATTRPSIRWNGGGSFLAASTTTARNGKDDDTVGSIDDSWSLIVLGDLHLEDDMTWHYQAREDCLMAARDRSIVPSGMMKSTTVKDLLPGILTRPVQELSINELEMVLRYKQQQQQKLDQESFMMDFMMNTHVVSLGDLGRKDIRHEPGDAGTTKSFLDAHEFLKGFLHNGCLSVDLVTGNHDLEGLDEFDTDAQNLKAWQDIFYPNQQQPGPQFARYIGTRTLLLGLSTVRFRDAPYSSHEVYIDPPQIQWFLQQIQQHPADDGWKILVFSHAPITGSGLRVLQNVHVTNGCAWLNHASEDNNDATATTTTTAATTTAATAMGRNIFIRTVQNNPQIKLWCSGHFHLSQDFADSLTKVNQCTFLQVGVMGRQSTRDGKRQSRLVQGNDQGMRIYTIHHHERQPLRHSNNGNNNDDADADATTAVVRLDAEMDFTTGTLTKHFMGQQDDIQEDENDDTKNKKKENWFQAYVPRQEDGCYIETPEGSIGDITGNTQQAANKVCWWHMRDGRVLGLHGNVLVEYDAETLSPLGIVVKESDLKHKEVLVVEQGTVLALVDTETNDIQVVHPNEDGSYWRKYQRNKRVRQEEKAREAAVKSWILKTTTTTAPQDLAQSKQETTQQHEQ